MPGPIHGKKAYVFISSNNNTNLMSFVTEYMVDTSPQDVARAKVLGTDAVPGVEGSSITAKAAMTLLLSEDEPDWDRALGNFSTNPDQIDINYAKAVSDLKAEQAWHIMSNVNVVLVALRDNLKVADASNISNLRALAGKIWELRDATVLVNRETAAVGKYVEIRLEVETGSFRKITNKVPIVA